MKRPLPPISEVLPEPTYHLPSVTASQLVKDFFEDNHIQMKLEAADNINVWDGTGVLLTDKPLLKIVYSFKEDK